MPTQLTPDRYNNLSEEEQQSYQRLMNMGQNTNWLNNTMRGGGGMLLNPSSAGNLGSYQQQQDIGNLQTQASGLAYDQAMQAMQPVTDIGAALGSRALQSAMGQSPGLQAIGEQYRQQMQRIQNQSTNLPSSSRQAQQNAMGERLGAAQARELQRSFAGDVGLYGQMAQAAGGIAQTIPAFNFDPNVANNPYTQAYLQNVLFNNM